jgi:hypothetical protein
MALLDWRIAMSALSTRRGANRRKRSRRDSRPDSVNKLLAASVMASPFASASALACPSAKTLTHWTATVMRQQSRARSRRRCNERVASRTPSARADLICKSLADANNLRRVPLAALRRTIPLAFNSSAAFRADRPEKLLKYGGWQSVGCAFTSKVKACRLNYFLVT